jgi:hypothetical protein
MKLALTLLLLSPLFGSNHGWDDRHTQNTPEPATFGLVGVTLLGAGLILRSRRGK